MAGTVVRTYIGTYEYLDLQPTPKDVGHLRRKLLKHQPFLRQVDIYLFQDTRRVRKIIRRLRAALDSKRALL